MIGHGPGPRTHVQLERSASSALCVSGSCSSAAGPLAELQAIVADAAANRAVQRISLRMSKSFRGGVGIPRAVRGPDTAPSDPSHRNRTRVRYSRAMRIALSLLLLAS